MRRVAIIDLTNPAAAAGIRICIVRCCAWASMLSRPISAKMFPLDAVFSNGQTGATMHNLYPLLYNRAVYEVDASRKKAMVWSGGDRGRRAASVIRCAGRAIRPLIGTASPARFAADCRLVCRACRSGRATSAAIAGCPSPDLFIRWAQFALLCSHARFHGDSPREPWAFGSEADQIVRAFAELRYRLIPVSIQRCSRGHLTGTAGHSGDAAGVPR